MTAKAYACGVCLKVQIQEEKSSACPNPECQNSAEYKEAEQVLHDMLDRVTRMAERNRGLRDEIIELEAQVKEQIRRHI